MGNDFNKIWFEVFTNRWAIFSNLFVLGLMFWGVVLDAEPYFDEEEQQAGYELVPNIYIETKKETTDLETKIQLTKNLIFLGEIEDNGDAEVQIRYVFVK